MTTLPNAEIWSLLLRSLTPHARSRIQCLYPSPEVPPFVSFVLEALEKDAAAGRPGPTSAPLIDCGLVIHAISEPSALDTPDAIRIATAAIKLDYRLDDKLLSRLAAPPRKWPAEVPEAESAQVLEVIDAISDCRRLVLPLMKFLKVPQHQLRSKAVKLIARARRNPGWAETILADPDPRVRSNLIDGLANQTGDQIDLLLRKGAKDPHHRVSTTALLQLCQRGDQASCEKIRMLAREGDESHRRAAEWALSRLEAANPEPAVSLPTPELLQTN